MQSLRFVLPLVAVLAALSLHPPRAQAFKIGYRGIKVLGIGVDDFPPVHEAVTSEAVRHFCEAEGLTELSSSPMFRALFTQSIASCESLVFGTDMDDWRSQIGNSPIGGLLLGARYPDLREMAGVDADKQDVTIVKYDNEVQIDSYRLYPQFHGQLSKYHNIWGGDQQRGLEHLRTFARAVLYEVAALLASFDPARAGRNDVVAANAMTDHDTNANLNGLFYDVRWHSILLGTLFHSIEDGFSHDPLHVLDVENNRLVRGAIFYGQFSDAEGNLKNIWDLYPEISPDMASTMDALKGYAPIVRHTPVGALDFADIPETSEVGGNVVQNYFEKDGKRYQSGHLATTLAMYAVAEFLSLLKFAVEHPREPLEVEARVNAYLDKWFTIDLGLRPGYTPRRTQDIAAVDPEYATLPWYNYHFADLWLQSGLADRTSDGKQAFILPWSDRASMGDILQSTSVEPHFVLMPSDEERYDEARRVHYLAPETFYLFMSWYRGGDAHLLKKKLSALDFFEDGKVRELEVELDRESVPGLDQVYASAFIPQGYRACFAFEPEEGAPAEKARTAAFDRSRPQYRCFYGTREGRWAHINFHLRKGTRVWLLPIDADGDGVAFLDGIAQGEGDNCPLVPNPGQEDSDADGVGDACPEQCLDATCAPGDGDGDGNGDGDGDSVGDGDTNADGGASGDGDGDTSGDGDSDAAQDGGTTPPADGPDSLASPNSGGCSVNASATARSPWSLLFAVLVGGGATRRLKRARLRTLRAPALPRDP